jgi:riboflavin biosynthesis pyrimidine reductase
VDFDEIVRRREREAADAIFAPLVTDSDLPESFDGVTIGNAWTRRYYDGDFHLLPLASADPSLSLVFVQTRDFNTGAHDPGELGGGAADKHLIYEGLSRVACDGVLAGARTAVGGDLFFSVWHPQLVALRGECGLPRHPAQIVISRGGDVDLAGTLLYNVPTARVFIVAAEGARRRLEADVRRRPWITIVAADGDDVRPALRALRAEHGIDRISCVGGRTAATSLLDARLVQDLCLTTTAVEGGEPNTPLYTGNNPPSTDLIVRKRSSDPSEPITFEHLRLR